MQTIVRSFKNAVLLFALSGFMACEGIFEANDNTIIQPEDIVNKGYPAAILHLQGSWVRLVSALDDVSYSCEIATENADETDSFIASGDIDKGDFFPSHIEFNAIYSGLHDARNQADMFLTTYLSQYSLSEGYPTVSGTPPVDVRRQTFVAYATLMRGWATLYLGLVFDQVNFNHGPRLPETEALTRAAADFEAIEALYAAGSPAPEATWTGIDIRKAANTLRAKTYLQLGRHDDAIAAASGGLLRTDPANIRSIGGVGLYSEAPGGNALYTSGFANSTQNLKRMSMSKWFIDRDSLDARVNLDSATAAGANHAKFGGNNRELESGVNLGFVRPRTVRKLWANPLSNLAVRVLSWQENSLIEAEAQLYKGAPDINLAVAAINNVRQGINDDAGSPIPLRGVTDLATARDDLEWEIRMELCVENGYYFMYNRRLDRNHYWNASAKYRFPIPNTE